jgi:hypothetical protein
MKIKEEQFLKLNQNDRIEYLLTASMIRSKFSIGYFFFMALLYMFIYTQVLLISLVLVSSFKINLFGFVSLAGLLFKITLTACLIFSIVWLVRGRKAMNKLNKRFFA